jgi:hypothetical protein
MCVHGAITASPSPNAPTELSQLLSYGPLAPDLARAATTPHKNSAEQALEPTPPAPEIWG